MAAVIDGEAHPGPVEDRHPAHLEPRIAGGAEAALAVEHHVAPHQPPEVVARIAGGEARRGEPVAAILQALKAIGIAPQVAVVDHIVGGIDACRIAHQGELGGIAAYQQVLVAQGQGALGMGELPGARHPHLGGLELSGVAAQDHLAEQDRLAIIAVAGAVGLAGHLPGWGLGQAVVGHHVDAATERAGGPLVAPGAKVQRLILKRNR